jgi:hypothetical protein
MFNSIQIEQSAKEIASHISKVKTECSKLEAMRVFVLLVGTEQQKFSFNFLYKTMIDMKKEGLFTERLCEIFKEAKKHGLQTQPFKTKAMLEVL